eukprot:g68171.t1
MKSNQRFWSTCPTCCCSCTAAARDVLMPFGPRRDSLSKAVPNVLLDACRNSLLMAVEGSKSAGEHDDLQLQSREAARTPGIPSLAETQPDCAADRLPPLQEGDVRNTLWKHYVRKAS